MLYVPPIVCGGSVLIFGMHYFISILFCNYLMRKRERVAFLLLSLWCLATVLPHDAVGWSAVCD